MTVFNMERSSRLYIVSIACMKSEILYAYRCMYHELCRDAHKTVMYCFAKLTIKCVQGQELAKANFCFNVLLMYLNTINYTIEMNICRVVHNVPCCAEIYFTE